MTPQSSQRSKLKKGKSVNSLDYESITESMLNLNRSSLKVRSYGLSRQSTHRTFGRTGPVRDRPWPMGDRFRHGRKHINKRWNLYSRIQS